MKKVISLLLLFCVVITSKVVAQEGKITVKGKVTATDTKMPLQGASVLVNGEAKGLSTDSSGNFTINLKKGQSILVSYVGYESQILTLNKSQTLVVALKSTSASAADEVVVIGYGTQKKSSLTGAVSKFKNERLDEVPVANLDQALQGKIAGVRIQNTTSEAGAASKINIRGISSVNAGAEPLVVVDGQPVPDGLAFVNIADVESVEVLKDAASAAIYGSRGASGVILITTKSGVADKVKYNFKYSIGQKKDYKRYYVMSTSEYVSLLFQEMALKKTDPSVIQSGNTVTAGDRAAYIIEQTMRGGVGTDWQSECLKPGLFQNMQLSASGGKKDVRYFISGGFQNDEGIMNKSGYQKYNVRAKIGVDLGKNVKMNFNINPSYSKKGSPSENYTNFYRFPSFLPVRHNAATAAQVNRNVQWANIVAGDYAHPRHFSGLPYAGFMPDGTWYTTTSANPSGSAQNNPKSSVDMQNNNTNEYRLQASVDLTVTILPGLNFKTLASSYLNYTNGLNFANRNASADGIPNKGIYTNNSNIDLLSENTFTYAKNIKQHSINLLAGFTTQKTSINKDQVTGTDYPSDNITTLNNATLIDKGGTFTTKNQIGLISYLGRITYAYANKYLLSASMRADGSSYFAPGNKWGSFPSISAGWVVSQEKFMDKVKWLNNLKLRASYGATGNNRITDFAWLDLLYSANYPFGSGNGTSTSGQGASASFLGNPDITWERTFSNNFGLDLSILKNKISLSVDVYESNTEKLLLQQSAMAFTGVPQFWNNNGSLKNNGIEVELNTKNINKKDFKWSTSFNISHTQNKVTELGKEAYLLNYGERVEVYQSKIGEPLVQYFGYKTDGIWLSQAQIDDAKAKGLTSNLTNVFTPGGLKLVDLNGDNVLDANDRTTIGNPYPDFTWGMTNTINFKAIDLSFSFQGIQGGKIINGDQNYSEAQRTVSAYNTNRWVSAMYPGDGKTPTGVGSGGFNWMLTDYVVDDASYYSLRDVVVGLTLPKSTIKKLGLSSARIYFSAQNLFFKFADNYNGINPEARSNSGPYASSLIDGYQRGGFPINKTFLFGADINF